ncbi:aldehyde dehydrogenase family protein (plasmid) [Mycolicibacterium frederiksbergense]|uniref:Aldehyde dehydrogenase family protein n=1 Tax=Mycolicibacterium frederiksbergense TaxID=117567 RepID=A0A6H0S0F4_9MYCO|nr:aldehyde dehydrogenase family protein [Mycolicibacterium frederiksbergense]
MTDIRTTATDRTDRGVPMTDNQDIRMLIDGELVPAVDGDWLESVNPANERVIARVPAGGEKDIERAVAAAEAAFVPWSRTPVSERAAMLRTFASRLRAEGIGWPHSRPRTPGTRSASHTSTSHTAPTSSTISPDWRTRARGRPPSPLNRVRLTSRCASPTVWSERSSRSTIP